MNRHYLSHQNEYDSAFRKVMTSGWYISGSELENFENRFASYVGVDYCVGLGNGLDALWIGLKALGITSNDEVIVQANTYIATVMSITINLATPIFVEPNEYFNIDVNKIEEKITDKTKAIMVVHLYGQSSQMEEIQTLCKKYNLYLIEDCAQSHGVSYKNKMTGSFGDIACFSFYPTKNLGAFGDGGALLTNNKDIAEKVRIFGNYGSEKRYHNNVIGTNSRLDEMQAALLNVKLNYLDELNLDRKKIADIFNQKISNPYILLPLVADDCDHIYHQYVIRCKYRNELVDYLMDNGVKTIIHYPIPPHLSEAYSNLEYKEGSFPISEILAKEVLSLTLFDEMTFEEANEVIRVVNNFKPLCQN